MQTNSVKKQLQPKYLTKGAKLENQYVVRPLKNLSLTMRKSLLNLCNLVSISKNLVFDVSLVVRIY